MAALQTIRSKGKVLIAVVGLALFAFIAEEFVRSLSYSQNESRQRIGEVYGESINIQEYSKLVEEYTSVVKFTSGMTSLTDDQLTMLRDQVWQTYVNQKLIEHEAEKLGLTVTDAELQNIISTGKSPLLAQTPFRTQQGTFDANALKQFLTEYNEVVNKMDITAESKEQYVNMYNYWQFIEKSLRHQTLAEKFQNLLTGAMLSNPVSAKMNFDARSIERDILMTAVPYTSVKDEEVKVEDADLQAKYEEMKEIFRTNQETRDIKYIDVAVKASQADKDALKAEMDGYAKALNEGGNAAKIVREAASKIPYSALPISANAFPSDIAKAIDTLKVGAQVGPYNNIADNSCNIIRLISKVELPDSVELRQIAVPGVDMEAAQKTADSIMTALQAGTHFDSIAKKYNQPGTKNWITGKDYEGQMMDENNRKFIETVTTASTGSYNKIVLDGQGVIIAQVTDRKNFINKYNAAVIKRTYDFSKETYGKAYNDFSAFLAGNPKAEDIEANAQAAGYTVQTRNAMSCAEHNVANVRRTSEALRWVFNEDTKTGDVSPLYECGDNDHMLVVILTAVNEKGYLPWNDEQVKTFLTTEVQKEKKAALLMEKMANVKSVADAAKIAGAVTDTIKHVTFGSNTFVSKVGTTEPALSGAVSTAKKGDFKAGIEGKGGVYAFQVLGQHSHETKFDEKKEMQQLTQMNMRALSTFTSELYQKANVEDKRYLFY